MIATCPVVQCGVHGVHIRQSSLICDSLTVLDMESTAPAADNIEQLREILGPSVARRRLRALLDQAAGSVPRAVDLHFGAEDNTTDVAEVSIGPSNDLGTMSPRAARQSTGSPAQLRRHRRDPPRPARQAGTPAWQALADFVELSSSTDNDFDPSEQQKCHCSYCAVWQ